ncbi:PAS domain S-box protein [Thermodesulfobacteriota bacterium]
MARKPTYEELEKRIKDLEDGSVRENEAMLLQTEKLAHIGSWQDDNVSENIKWSEEIFRIFGRDTDQGPPTRTEFWEYLHPDDALKLQPYIKEARETGKPFQLEFRIIKPDGSTRWVLGRGKGLKDESGKVTKIHGSVLDVTERRYAGEALKESEKKYRELVNSLPQAVFETDEKGNLMFTNENAFKLFGYSREDFEKGLNAIQMLIPEDRERGKANMQRILEGENLERMEYTALRKDGGTFPVVIHSTPILRDNKPAGLRGLLIDITERKRAEKKLKQSGKTLRTIIESMPFGVVIIGKDKKIRRVNLPALRLTGYQDESEIVGRLCNEILCPAEGGWCPILDLGQEIDRSERKIITKNGESISVLKSVVPLRLDGEEVLLEGFVDITERKEAEDELRKSEERYKDLFENAGELIQSVDVEGKFLSVNKKWLETIGYTREELKDILIWDIIHPDSRNHCQESFQRVLTGESSNAIEAIFISKEGKAIPVEGNVNCRFMDGKPIATRGIFRDITERLQAEEKRKKLEAQLQQALKMEAIGTLAGGIAHDFNNILGIILGNTELAMMDTPAWSPARHNLVEAQKACIRARDVVKQILTFSRMSDEEIKPFRITPIVRESLKLLRSSIQSTIEIRQNISASRDIVHGNPTQINQVLLNLCTNAAFAMRETGGILEVGLEDGVFDKEGIQKYQNLTSGTYAVLTIKDTGAGIEPDILNRIFDPYFTTKRVGEGTGMGLAVAHGIVQSHGGQIAVESIPNEGTTFRVLFPSVEEKVPDESDGIIRLPRGDESILLVDDEKAMVDTVRPILERLGYHVTAKTSSLEALEAFRHDPNVFDLVITDQTMPNMTGVALTREITEIRPDIPVILCTGYSEMVDEARAKEIGMQAFVMKPIVMSEIAVTIREVLD